MDESELIFPISLGARDEYTSGGPGQRRETDSDSDDQSSVSLEEKKEKGSNAYYSEVLLSLMADLSMGYDPSNLPQYAMSVFPSFWEDMFPGSLNHLMVILFGSNSELDSCQISMHKWLDEHFDCQPTRPHIRTTMNMIDESIFGSELEMIRALVAPLRGDMTHRVFWLHSRPYYAKDLCDEVEASMRLIEKFQEDLVAGQVVPDQHRK